MEKTPRDPTQAAMSGPVSAVPTELPTPQDVGFFSGPGQHKYQFNMQDVGSPDSQQYAITRHSQLIQRTSSAAELGDPGATAISTNLQSSTVLAAVFNHGIVTPGQSPASYDGFIDEDIVSMLMFSDTWNTHSDFALPSQLLPPQSPPRPQTNPFDDCSGLFGHDSPLPKFPRPADGEVNSYVKFNWPRPPLQRQCPAPQASTSTLLAGSSSTYRRSSNLPPSQIGASLPSPARSFRSCYQNDITTVPQLLLPQFGHNARMDSTDRKLFQFCKFCFRHISLEIRSNSLPLRHPQLVPGKKFVEEDQPVALR
ncbi:hypothetical protein ISF_09695 [Cordyceps fumosorosea ARSEF 2679]|uniref:Uncharacterized protein n=1 Tax=Cordyceps fumosorosea (strain ARSEF 2679) TaxID=1081104 RepID=A0A167DRW4_CORFA|nr:hypothetical protein ISF_09695 [Cordyceps fumosorosea ARSEF 2679]OAA42779.1 hypothetical protein ISF_09695 [Cordyceps fumosorosea ARSEF 2679]